MTEMTVWNGTSTEMLDLMKACSDNCECALDGNGVRVTTCAAHAMLTDQRSLNRLLYGRRLVEMLQREEGLISAL